ncbi:HesA/MoeB/ThiF family protein [Agathobaculum sp.]|uniref:HesA/MoeB/ThiF family protein n=1 Tax=Agathobaculum sp. TaxID=2048138 RepID=UPI002A7EE110|nr:HesA/MoeB/ThiF family protein [Agathobaculum sp.]MDY3618693.1 HesA/MoeB/ThiF family protein [Agathobaculum sp.]
MRFERQIKLTGAAGQARLQNARVTVIGAGGLGCPVLVYLAAAGVGAIRIVDGDAVSESNLNRQFLYHPDEVGKSKAVLAGHRLRQAYPKLHVETFAEAADENRAGVLCAGSDLVVCCVDSMEARYLIEHAALSQGIPVIDGGVGGADGFVLAAAPGGPCLGCMTGGAIGNAGAPQVLGASAGMIGSMQAGLAVEVLLGGRERFGQYTAIGFAPFSLTTFSIESTCDCQICQKKY